MNWFQRIFPRSDLSSATSRQTIRDDRLSPQAVAQLNQLRLVVDKRVPGAGAGLRPSARRRSAYDFREHRMYVPGDDIRFVDWKASARQEQTFIRQGEDPEDTTVFLLLDGSASMAWGAPPKARMLTQVAAALGFVALSQEDRLVIKLVNDQELLGAGRSQWGPSKGKGHVPELLKFVRDLEFGGKANWLAAVRGVSQRSGAGLVIVLSDLLDAADLPQALLLLPRPAWNVIVLHLLHADEMQPGETGNLQLVDIESGAVGNYDITQQALRHYDEHLKNWLAGWEDELSHLRARYCLLRSDWSLAEEMIPALRQAEVLAPL